MEIASYLKMGGVTMWGLLALAVAGLVIVVERLVAISRAAIDINDFLGRTRKALVTNRSPREAIKICEQFRGPVPSMVKAGLLKYGQPRDDVEQTLRTAALFEKGRLERFLPVLATLAAVTPMLGFLGTAAGFMQALDALAAADTVDAAALALALEGPLVTTVAGLSIGILLRIAYGWLVGRVARVERDIDTANNMLLETFGDMERGGAPVVSVKRFVVGRAFTLTGSPARYRADTRWPTRARSLLDGQAGTDVPLSHGFIGVRAGVSRDDAIHQWRSGSPATLWGDRERVS